MTEPGTEHDHYRAGFDLFPCGNPQALWDSAQSCVRDWLFKECNARDFADTWFLDGGAWSAPGQTRSVVTRASGIARGGATLKRWAMRCEYLCPEVAHRTWIGNVGFEQMGDERISVRIRVLWRQEKGGEQGDVAPPAPAAPWFVRSLIEPADRRAKAGSTTLSPGPMELGGQASRVEFRQELSSRDRACPIIAVSRRKPGGLPAIDVQDLAARLVGAAVVVVPANEDSDEKTRFALPESHRFFSGAVRVYWPDLDFEKASDGSRHTHFLPEDIQRLTRDGVVHQIAAEILGRSPGVRPGAIYSIEDIEVAKGSAAPAGSDVKNLEARLKGLESQNRQLSRYLRNLEWRLGRLESAPGPVLPKPIPPGKWTPIEMAEPAWSPESAEFRTAYDHWSDDDLFGLLHQAGDRLPGGAVTEMALRDESKKWRLKAILENPEEWERVRAPWAAIHAVLLYADFGRLEEGEDWAERWQPLRAAIRFSIASQLDETLLADLPLVMSIQGPWVWDRLPDLAQDRTLSVRERRVYIYGLSHAAKSCGDRKHFDALRAVAGNAGEPLEIRGFAARRLLDWAREEDREILMAAATAEQSGTGYAEILPAEVEESLARGVPDLTLFLRNFQHYHSRPSEFGPEPDAPPEMPLPSWREEECARLTRACEPFFVAAEAECPGLRATAAYMLDVLVRRRLSAPRYWRQLDVAAFVAAAAREPAKVPEESRPAFAEDAARFIEILARRELFEIGRPREMAAWLRRRAERLRLLVRRPLKPLPGS